MNLTILITGASTKGLHDFAHSGRPVTYNAVPRLCAPGGA
jgi:hypothetical protein